MDLYQDREKLGAKKVVGGTEDKMDYPFWR